VREGQGTTLSPLPLAQLCRSLLPAPPQILSARSSPGCCGDDLRRTPSATTRTCAVRRNRSLNQLTCKHPFPQTIRENFPPACSAAACPAGCGSVRSAAPPPTTESGLVNSGALSQRIAPAIPRSAMIGSGTRVALRVARLVSSLSAKHLLYRRQPRSALGSLALHHILHKI
jgi:hypothetical protein